MKNTVIDGAYVGSVGLIAWLGITTLNDALLAISGFLACLVGAGRLAIVVRDWRQK